MEAASERAFTGSGSINTLVYTISGTGTKSRHCLSWSCVNDAGFLGFRQSLPVLSDCVRARPNPSTRSGTMSDKNKGDPCLSMAKSSLYLNTDPVWRKIHTLDACYKDSRSRSTDPWSACMSLFLLQRRSRSVVPLFLLHIGLFMYFMLKPRPAFPVTGIGMLHWALSRYFCCMNIDC